MSQVALVHIGCGRHEYQARTLTSFLQQVRYPWAEVVVVDDSARRGWWWSIQEAWRQVRTMDVEYVFHLEDDWTFPRPVDVADMGSILRCYPHLANLVLRRQPWGHEGPNGYIDFDFVVRDGYLEHDRGFWLNPCMYPIDIPRRYEWGEGMTEGDFTKQLLPDGWRFGVYGKRDDEPRCWHIGIESAIFA